LVGGIIPLRRATSSRFGGRLRQESADIAVMSWAVANGLLRVKLLGTPFDGQSVEP
jgi:hypothetical protein